MPDYLCPPNLVDMWTSYRERYKLNGKVMSLGKVTRELPEEYPYNLVLIDESHQLRNQERQDYKVIRDYIERKGSRVILLTATPFNKQYQDLAAQILLFESRDRDLGIRPEAAIRKAGGQGLFQQSANVNPRTLAAFERSDEAEDWQELMRRYLVRRTRSFILNHYAHRDENGKPFLQRHDGTQDYFPNRLPKTVQFAMQNSPYASMVNDEVVDLIDSLELPRYALRQFITADAEHLATPEQWQTIENLGIAGVRLRGFSRTNMLKRLESSGQSFLLTVRRHLLRNEIFLHALENDKLVPATARNGANYLLDVFDDDEDTDAKQLELDDAESDETPSHRNGSIAIVQYMTQLEQHREKHNWLPASFFSPTLIESLKKDTAALRQVLQLSAGFSAENDPKLIALKKLLTETHPNEKVLIFTQYADTAAWIGKNLKDAVPNSAIVSGKDGNPTKIAKRFSPISNKALSEVSQAQEVRVLIATDVLSEGQNLQDGHIVVNYDLPWAIIKLIQRIGRVDRIGQKAKEIIAYSFLPADGIEQLIRLRERVQVRLQQNADVVTSDEVFFEGDTFDPEALRNIYNEKSAVLDDDDTDQGVDIPTRALAIWQNAIAADPSLKETIEKLNDMVYSSRSHDDIKHGPAGALVYVRSGDGTDALVRVNNKDQVVTQSTGAILDIAACEPDTPALPRPAHHHRLVRIGAMEGIKRAGAMGSALGRRTDIRYRVYERARNYDGHIKHPLLVPAEVLKYRAAAMEAVLNYPLLDSARNQLSTAMKENATDDALMALLVQLHLDGALSSSAGAASMQAAHIICSIGLVDDRV